MSSAGAGGGGGGGNNGYTGPGRGLVLVFDLDQTLIDSHGSIMDEVINKAMPQNKKDELIDKALNKRLVEEVLRPASRLRGDPNKVDAICLLTNNSDRNYVFEICKYLHKLLKSPGAFESVRRIPAIGDPDFPEANSGENYFFDYIMVRQHSSRPKWGNPAKRLRDVEFMLNALKKSTNDLERRTFFFDDMLPTHVINMELTQKGYPDHYTIIKNCEGDGSGGFITGIGDCSDYTPVTEAFRRGVPYSPPVQYAQSAPSTAQSYDQNEQEERQASEFMRAARATMKPTKPSGLSLLFNPPSSGGSTAATAAAAAAANQRAQAYEGGRRYKKTKKFRYKNKNKKPNKSKRRR
jgi:hypothetical protein